MAQKKATEMFHRIHTRKIDRAVAKRRMKSAGLHQICKHSKGDKHGSYFALHWDEFRD